MPKVYDESKDPERRALMETILEILEIDENNNKFTVQDIDNDEIKQGQIYDLIPTIKSLYVYSTWHCLNKRHITSRPWLSLVKQMCKINQIPTKMMHSDIYVDSTIIRTNVYNLSMNNFFNN